MAKLQKLSNVDRISDLPDSLLLHILSFLLVKSAALTSSLSKRWEHFCMSLPILDFNDDDFLGNPTNFSKRVDYMLTVRRNDVILQRFSLSYGEDIDAGHVESWLWRPIRYNSVKLIKLSLDFTNTYKLPSEVYTCATLQVLTLNRNVLIDVPQFVFLPSLSVLEVCGVTFSSTELVEKLLIDCPVLDKLHIRDCTCLTGNRVHIFGSALKTLRLQYSAFFEQVELEILIDVPTMGEYLY